MPRSDSVSLPVVLLSEYFIRIRETMPIQECPTKKNGRGSQGEIHARHFDTRAWVICTRGMTAKAARRLPKGYHPDGWYKHYSRDHLLFVTGSACLKTT